MRRWLSCAVLATLGFAPARAEMGASDYRIDEAIEPGRAREQVEAQIAREIDDQARRAEREAVSAARRLAQDEAVQARRPYPQRLLQARCTLCHPADNYLNQRHTGLGWHLVVGRMRFFNRAPISWDEQHVLAGELARLQPAAPTDAMIEYAAGSAALALPLLLGWGWRRRTRWRRA